MVRGLPSHSLEAYSSWNMPMPTHFIGDIHGCAEEFEDLLSALGHATERDRLLLTGDLFSRGPDPLGVWRIIERVRPELVLGNHDVRLLKQLRAMRSGESPRIRYIDERRVIDSLAPVVDSLFEYLEASALFIREPEFILVHAGVHPKLGLEATKPKMLYTVRTWPPVKGVVGPRWHDVYQPEPDAPPIVFGHDAPGGLTVKRRENGTPTIIGLDSGCIYGGALSAWRMEDDEIVQVPSRQRAVF